MAQPKTFLNRHTVLLVGLLTLLVGAGAYFFHRGDIYSGVFATAPVVSLLYMLVRALLLVRRRKRAGPARRG